MRTPHRRRAFPGEVKDHVTQAEQKERLLHLSGWLQGRRCLTSSREVDVNKNEGKVLVLSTEDPEITLDNYSMIG